MLFRSDKINMKKKLIELYYNKMLTHRNEDPVSHRDLLTPAGPVGADPGQHGGYGKRPSDGETEPAEG